MFPMVRCSDDTIQRALASNGSELTWRVCNSDTTVCTGANFFLATIPNQHHRSLFATTRSYIIPIDSSAKFPRVTMDIISWAQTAAVILGIYYIVLYLERALRRRLLLKHTCVLDIDTLGRRLPSQKIKGTAVICGGR